MRKFVAPSIVPLGLSLSLLGTLVPAPARAHFKLNAIDDKMDVSWMSQDDQGAPQKTGPCAAVGMGAGDPAGTPTGKVTNVKAGQMVSIAVNGTVGHTGWYRVSLVEGSSSSQTLTTLPDPKLQTGCTPAIMSSPVWSTTQPVIGDALPAGSTAMTRQTGDATLKVMIPQNANCTTAKPCTLQVVMIMTDHSPGSCFYHHCADITLGGGSSGAGGASAGGAGGGSSSASGGAGGRMAAGGVSGSGSGGDTTTASGGTSGSGGATASGGVSGSGGATASGGASASGGATSSGGSSASGGATSSGGALASGGTTGSGGKTSSSGGTTGSGGGASPAGSGGAGTGADNSSGGCAVAAGRGEAALLPLLAGLLLVARARRRGARP